MVINQNFSASCWWARCANLVKTHTSRLVAYSLRNLHNAGGHCLTTWGLCCGFQCPVTILKVMLKTNALFREIKKSPPWHFKTHILTPLLSMIIQYHTSPSSHKRNTAWYAMFFLQTDKAQEIGFYVAQSISSLIIFKRPQTAKFEAIFLAKWETPSCSQSTSTHINAIKHNYM